MIILQTILFSKELLACTGCFGLFTKIKTGSRTWWTFYAYFSIRISLIWYCINWSDFNIRPTFLLKTSMFLNSCLANWWRHKLYDLSSIILLELWLTGGKKRGRCEYKILNTLREKRKIADTSLNFFFYRAPTKLYQNFSLI